jgi:hypothetical protein
LHRKCASQWKKQKIQLTSTNYLELPRQMGRGWQRAADCREAKNYEGVELLKKALQLRSVELLFAVDKLMSELVAPPGPTDVNVSRVITLAPLNAFNRKLVHIMVRYSSSMVIFSHG